MRTAMMSALVGVGLLGSLVAFAQESDGPIRRGGSVDLHETYDMSDLRIPEDQIHTLLPRDAIPALTDPETAPVGEAGWLEGDDRVIAVEVGGEAVAAPLRIMNWHEVANMTVGGAPIAATYCPLCDSATVISRRVEAPDGSTKTLEFGVSGALYNSNVLMYDRQTMSLWSQLGMRAVSGEMAGTALDHLPARVVSWARFSMEHPTGRVLTRDTGHQRDYGRDPYASYFENPDYVMVPVEGMGDALPKKTLGVGVATDRGAWFVSEGAIGEDGYTLKTDAGEVRLARTEAGVEVESAPEGVRTAQTFYYSWSAFHPETEVIGEKG